MTALSPLRTGRITGSRVGAILGLNRYQTRDDVMRELVRDTLGAEREFLGSEATEYGNDHEEDARSAFEAKNGVLVLDAQKFFIHPEHDFLGVSVDGLVGEDEIVEFKCPWRARYRSIQEKPDYRAQVQLQLACTGREGAWFVIWREAGHADRIGVQRLIIERVLVDPAWLPLVLPELAEFHAEYLRVVADEDLAAPYLADLERSDADWVDAAGEFRAADEAVDVASKRLDSAKARLRKLAGERSARGCGVSVSRVERAGAVDWKAVAGKYAADVDVDVFRKPSAVVYSVRTVES